MLYHITFARNIGSIAENGLFPGSSSNFPGYSGHASGKLFVCTFPAVDCWMHKIHYVGLDNSDNPVEEGFFPVVLKVLVDLSDDLVPDEMGNSDCRSGDNFFTEMSVDPEDLLVWVGNAWRSLDSDIESEIIETALSLADVDEDDGEQWYELDEDAMLPKHASVLHTSLRPESLLRWTGEETFTGGKVFRMLDIKADSFIHFTLLDRAVEILEDGYLRMRPPYKKFGIDVVNAVSTLYGDFVPGIQVSHLKGDEELVAILFKTSTLPKYGHVEEVVWETDVKLLQPELLDPDDAIALLKNTPAAIDDDDQVIYQ